MSGLTCTQCLPIDGQGLGDQRLFGLRSAQGYVQVCHLQADALYLLVGLLPLPVAESYGA